MDNKLYIVEINLDGERTREAGRVYSMAEVTTLLENTPPQPWEEARVYIVDEILSIKAGYRLSRAEEITWRWEGA